MPTPLRLVTIPISHYCEKVRWALDRQRLPYREDGHAPGLHMLTTLPVTHLRSRTVPILVDDGQVIADSTEILAHLSAKHGAGWLYAPPDALALEEEFDKSLGPHTRRLAYFYLLPDRKKVLEVVTNRVPAWQARIERAIFGGLEKVMRRELKINPEAAARSQQRIEQLLDKLSDRLRDGRRYLCGDSFSAADLTFAALAAPILAPPEHTHQRFQLADLPPELRAVVERFRATPAGQLGLRLYRQERHT